MTTFTYGDADHVHAVTAASDGGSFSYDANGNMTSRTVGDATYTLTYDAENRLVTVSGDGVSAAFYYDGDGNRVRSIIGGSQYTYYVGNYYELYYSGGNTTIKKYYYAGTQMAAVRVSGSQYTAGLFFILGDHLGSTSITTTSSGSKVAEARYTAWGETRYNWTAANNTWGSTPEANAAPTTVRYTGQRKEIGLAGPEGLYYCGASW